MNKLQEDIDSLYNLENKLTLTQYNKLLRECVNYKEMGATVFVYDHMLIHRITPTDETFKIIEKIHSKTISESKNIILKPSLKKTLQPRRRIHKIIKGYNYSDNYQKALVHLDMVKKYLNENQHLKTIQNKHALAKTISKKCQISIRDSRYIVTNLKRTKFLIKKEDNNILHYFEK